MAIKKTRSFFTLLLANVLLVFSYSYAYASSPVEVAKLLASDGTNGNNFGYSVAVSANTAIIGAPNAAPGAAYLFTRDSSGNWSEDTKLVPSGESGDGFGSSVALDNNIALVGAPGDNENGKRNGAVYVFVRDEGGNWSQQAKLTAHDDSFDFFHFGWSVAISGSTAVIGNFYNRGGYPVYVFTRNTTGGWSQEAKLYADGTGAVAFGENVTIEDDTVVISAHREGNGSAYVFTRDETGAWARETKLNATDGTLADQFGYSIAISSDTIVVGAWLDDDLGNASGSAYVFGRDGMGNWSERVKLTAKNGAESDVFGHSLAVKGDILVIGKKIIDNGNFSGSASFFKRDSGGSWIEEANLVAFDGWPDDRFATSIAIGDDAVLIGANANSNANAPAGSVYVFALENKDSDGDGVYNDADLCVLTPPGMPVNPQNGCSIAQLCPCEGPRGSDEAWRNHGKYVSCVAHATNQFEKNGLITEKEKDALTSAAGQSSCGKKII